MANVFNNQLTSDVGTTPVVVYSTNSVTKATVIGINISNNTTSTVTADIILDNGVAEVYIVKGARIPAGTALAAMGGDQKLVINESSTLSVQTDTATSSDVVVSVLEITV
jgi:N-acetylmuramic acid 6-phosphate (MurNAc-6-P) etherase